MIELDLVDLEVQGSYLLANICGGRSEFTPSETVVIFDDNMLDMIKLLFANPRVDPSIGGNCAILRASLYGHAEVVRMLLTHPRVDPSADGNYTLRKAIEYGHHELANQLIADSRVFPFTARNTQTHQDLGPPTYETQ